MALAIGLGSSAWRLLRFLRLLGFPGLELLPFGLAFGALFLDLVELLLLVRLEQGADVGLGFLLTGSHFVLHGFLFGGWQFFQVLVDQLLTVVHLLAHDFADLLALFAAQVELPYGPLPCSCIWPP